MTDDEKKCLKVAKNFLAEAAKEFGYFGGNGENRIYFSSRDDLAFDGPLIGQLASDKFRACIKGADQDLSK